MEIKLNVTISADEKLLSALSILAEAIQTGETKQAIEQAPVQEEPVKEEPAPTPAPTPAPAPVEKQQEEITSQMMQKACTELAKAKGASAVLAVLNGFGYKGLSLVPTEKYGALLAILRKETEK